MRSKANFLLYAKKLLTLLILCFLPINAYSMNADATTIKFGVQSWPSVVVTTEVARDLLNSLGYSTEKTHSSTPIILHALATEDDLDVSLGVWYPGAANMVKPLLNRGQIIQIAKNLTEAKSGLAVPMYVHNAGIYFVSDLNKHADKFNHKIYGIEPGSSANITVSDAIKSNKFDLGDWKLMASSSSVMLTELKRKISQNKWIVFYAWKPHWMNKVYDLYYLRSKQKTDIADRHSFVYTLVSKNFPAKYPNITRFLKQFKVSSKTENAWIYSFSKKNKSIHEIARAWIPSHLKVVRHWLEGVKSISGDPAFPIIKSAFE